VEAHGGSIRSIAAIPHENGFVIGSADYDVKFWEYQIKQKSGQVCSSYDLLLTFLKFCIVPHYLLFRIFVQVETLFYEQHCTYKKGPITSSIMLLNDNDDEPSTFS